MERRAKILLIDDDPDFVEATKVVLESRPYEIITAFGGEEGLKKAREEKPDLVLLDVIMPDMNGFQVCQQLKKDLQLSQIPVIMITSSPNVRKAATASFEFSFKVSATAMMPPRLPSTTTYIGVFP